MDNNELATGFCVLVLAWFVSLAKILVQQREIIALRSRVARLEARNDDIPEAEPFVGESSDGPVSDLEAAEWWKHGRPNPLDEE